MSRAEVFHRLPGFVYNLQFKKHLLVELKSWIDNSYRMDDDQMDPFAKRLKLPKRETFTMYDQSLLKRLILEHDRDRILDSARRDAGTKEKKDKTWTAIVSGFNAGAARKTPATKPQLKALYDRMKTAVRSHQDQQRQQSDRNFTKKASKTGGGPLLDDNENFFDDDLEETPAPNKEAQEDFIINPEETSASDITPSLDSNFEKRVNNLEPLPSKYLDAEKSKEDTVRQKRVPLSKTKAGSEKSMENGPMEAFFGREEERSKERHAQLMMLIEKAEKFLDDGIRCFNVIEKKLGEG